MPLSHTAYGSGSDVIILHGLFGSARNWASVAKALSAHHHVHALDLRNHGESFWAWSNGVTLDFSRPGKPTDNAFVESFNGKVRAECIDQNWFLSLDDARSKCEAYRREHNEERPHSAIGNKTPMEFIKTIGHPSHPMV